ncbi:MurR/RpiR family transcriptional regulator [Pseudohoeflea suaedae]|uniref:MurR/RpiR family transcriptional regulator n=1 Tax=Pseudohoeflea suaedae TaxID=877384 RepID=A0A4R5PL30_9HYPH|nr:MurR/RpiR family transcriptional regulator [Pseudohoeflea suaedae]TDH37623.1 MurR/RpiR family transcriptional regulator [Pseudohoeflea suaedae]
MTIREQVHAKLGALPGAEKKVAHAFLALYPSAGLSTIAELAKAAGTSAPTVLRFVTRLGFESYPEFQRALRDEVQAQMASPSPLERGRSTKSIQPDTPGLTTSFAGVAANLDATLKAIPESEFDAACELMSDPKSACYFLGGRFTDFIAGYMAAHLRIIRPNVRRFTGQTSTWHDQLLDMKPGDVVVLFDIRRYQTDLVRLGEILLERRARIVLITDPWLSPLARSAHVVLPCVVEAGRTWDSSVPLLALAEALIDRVSRRQWSNAQNRMQALEDIHWNKTPQQD